MTEQAVRDAAGDSAILAHIPYVDTKSDRIELRYDRRDFDFAVERHRVAVGNMRALAPRLDREGFTFVRWPSEVVKHRWQELVTENAVPREDIAPVNADYLAELLPLIEQVGAGAREVFAQYGTITVRFSSRASERSWMSTAAFAHLDFEKSAMDRLLADTLMLTGREVKPFSRQVLYQTWRVITDPPQDEPLALCDGRTVAADDVIPMDFFGPPGSRNEFIRSRACRFSPTHRWYYLPEQTTEEVLLFKGFDSNSPDAGNAMHTAFHNAALESPVPRGSIECRFIALYD
ncbi:MAG TPA: CmcJ/NvfI family oxidoreductase [Sphingomonadaceae bacterium]